MKSWKNNYEETPFVVTIIFPILFYEADNESMNKKEYMFIHI